MRRAASWSSRTYGEVRRAEWLDGAWTVTGASIETLPREQLDAWIDAKLSGGTG
jgi:hypothetical protein